MPEPATTTEPRHVVETTQSAPAMPHANGSEGGPAVPPAANPAAPSPAVQPSRRGWLRLVLIPIVVAVLGVAAYVGYNFWRESQLYVTTDNAQITGQPVQVGALATGRVARIVPHLGVRVRRGEVIAQVALPTQTGTYQNGAPKMGFLGDSDSTSDVQAPIDGVVIALPAAVGDTVAAGQPIVTLVDPHALWVNANIEETQFNRLHVGERVDVHVDALDAIVPGIVEQVTPATAATFSLLPASNASGNFNKVTQLVPVRIAVDLGDSPTLLGASVEVKIHVTE